MSEPGVQMTHVEAALHLLGAGERDAFTGPELLAAAQVHATLALVEAVENWQPPTMPEEDQGVTQEEFATRWRR